MYESVPGVLRGINKNKNKQTTAGLLLIRFLIFYAYIALALFLRDIKFLGAGAVPVFPGMLK